MAQFASRKEKIVDYPRDPILTHRVWELQLRKSGVSGAIHKIPEKDASKHQSSRFLRN